MIETEQLAKVMETLGRLDERTLATSQAVASIDRSINGNGQPGLQQRVEALEGHENRAIGAMTVLGTIGAGVWGVLEYIFHRGGH